MQQSLLWIIYSALKLTLGQPLDYNNVDFQTSFNTRIYLITAIILTPTLRRKDARPVILVAPILWDTYPSAGSQCRGHRALEAAQEALNSLPV